jgi:small GTP-binding protein
MASWDDSLSKNNINMCFCGDAAVGKTAFITKVTEKYFNPCSTATVGIDFKVHTVCFTPLEAEESELMPTVRAKTTIWDTAGQERYRGIVNSYFRDKDIIVVVYAVDNITSFDNVDTWLQEAKLIANKETQFILVGTKSDMPRVVLAKEGKRKSKRLGFADFMETSAKVDSAEYTTPLEVMKKIAQLWWAKRENKRLQFEQDLANTKAGYVTGSFPDGVVPLEYQDPPRKKCSC